MSCKNFITVFSESFVFLSVLICYVIIPDICAMFGFFLINDDRYRFLNNDRLDGMFFMISFRKSIFLYYDLLLSFGVFL